MISFGVVFLLLGRVVKAKVAKDDVVVKEECNEMKFGLNFFLA